MALKSEYLFIDNITQLVGYKLAADNSQTQQIPQSQFVTVDVDNNVVTWKKQEFVFSIKGEHTNADFIAQLL